jgi:RHS repeat-associated protein
MWDAVTGGSQIQSITLQQSGGAPTNRVSTVNTVSYAYDSSGNVVSDGLHSYGYDAENRMTSADSGSTGSYRYDYQNRRIQKVTGGAAVHYVWEGSQVIAEYNVSTGMVAAEYIVTGGRILAKVESGVTSYLLADKLSTRLVLDSAGSVVAQQSHFPYGEGFVENGAMEKHRFTSYERDGESAIDYAINRAYSHGIGRFMQVDRIAGSLYSPQRLNRFSYTRNNPVNRTDRLGLDDCPDGSSWDPKRGGCFDDQPIDGGTVHAGEDEIDLHDASSDLPGPYSGSFDPLVLEGPRPNHDPIHEEINLEPPKPTAGLLTVDSGCKDIIYLPEGNEDTTASAWKDARGADRSEVDFVATPRGVVKIPDTCKCSVSCSDGDDYVIQCRCSAWAVPEIMQNKDYGKQFPDPKPPRGPHRFIDSREPYTFVGRTWADVLIDTYTYSFR